MENQLINVRLDDDTDEIAKIVSETDTTYVIRYLRRKEYDDCNVYKYSKNTTEIEKECVSGFYDTDREEAIGLERDGNKFIEYLDDEYEPETDSDSDESVSLDEENSDEEI